jgi:hypothetical protein
MTRPVCPVEEDVVRAICEPDHFDPIEGRIKPSLFKGENTSLSRLKIIPLAEHWDLFRKHVQKPHRRLVMFGEISVGNLISIGRDFHIGTPGNRVAQPVTLTVEEAPEEWNPAHAEIPQKISRGLANEIIPALKQHAAP